MEKPIKNKTYRPITAKSFLILPNGVVIEKKEFTEQDHEERRRLARELVESQLR